MPPATPRGSFRSAMSISDCGGLSICCSDRAAYPRTRRDVYRTSTNPRYEVSLSRGLAYDAGQRRARIGRGLAVRSSREYQPDDDPRSIPGPRRSSRPAISVE